MHWDNNATSKQQPIFKKLPAPGQTQEVWRPEQSKGQAENQQSQEDQLKVNYKGGTLPHCLQFWKSLTSDKYVLDIVCGYRIEFNDKWLGYQPQVPSIAHFDSQTSRRISASISELISFGVVHECKFELGQFLWPIFIVSRPDSTYRKILNLKRFNEFVTYKHFKMENLTSLCDILSHGCYLTSINLRKAYYSVSMSLLTNFMSTLLFGNGLV